MKIHSGYRLDSCQLSLLGQTPTHVSCADFPDLALAEILSSPAHTTHIAKDDLVFFMDAMDVWLQLPPDYLVRRFLEFDADIVIGNDKVCWPNSFKSVSTESSLRERNADGPLFEYRPSV
jgi:hypothetical protein